ncbi:MAG: c-type cytochrome domain-containing protein, partial [Planctomycetaceae bacterium]
MSRWTTIGLLTALSLSLATQAAAKQTPDQQTPAKPNGTDPRADAERLFTLKVLPVLKVKCFGCHGSDPQDHRGDFDIRSRKGMLKGGESKAAALLPGHPEDSPLFTAVNWDGLEMPPKKNDRLTTDQINSLRLWIRAGAPWPDATTQEKYREEN